MAVEDGADAYPILPGWYRRHPKVTARTRHIANSAAIRAAYAKHVPDY